MINLLIIAHIKVAILDDILALDAFKRWDSPVKLGDLTGCRF